MVNRMSPFKILQIVNKAIPKAPFTPILANFYFYKDRVQANNGRLCIDGPFKLGLELTVEGKKFLQAMKLCKDEFTASLTPTGKLSLKNKKFKALLQTAPATNFPVTTLDEGIFLDPGLISVLKKLKPFTSPDKTRPWAQSIQIKSGFAYATNNVIIARVPYASQTNFVVPSYAIDILIAIGEEPLLINIHKNYLGFHYENGVWLRCCNIDFDWPDLAKLIIQTETAPLPENFLVHLKELLPFCSDMAGPVFSLDNEGIHTDSKEHTATLEIAVFYTSIFRAEPLMLAAAYADNFDFKAYPNPCYFSGPDGLEGVIMGVA